MLELMFSLFADREHALVVVQYAKIARYKTVRTLVHLVQVIAVERARERPFTTDLFVVVVVVIFFN